MQIFFIEKFLNVYDWKNSWICFWFYKKIFIEIWKRRWLLRIKDVLRHEINKLNEN